MDRQHGEEDRQLYRSLCEGGSHGVRLLLVQHGGRVRAHLRRRFPSLRDDDIEDALVDATLALVASYRPEKGPLGAWFLLLARQKAVDLLRGHRGRSNEVAVGDREFPDEAMRPDEMLEDREQREEVRAALATLSELERAVIEADIEAGGAAEAAFLASRLGTTERSIYSARNRARRKLEEKLAPRPAHGRG